MNPRILEIKLMGFLEAVPEEESKPVELKKGAAA